MKCLSASLFLIVTAAVLEASPLLNKNSYDNTAKNQQIFNIPVIPEEEMIYDLNFLWFQKAAEGRVYFKKVKDNEFVAILEAETKGFIGWLFYRHYRYVSYIKAVGDNELRCVLFERTVVRRMSEEKSISKIDYDSRELQWWIYKNGKLYKNDIEPIPDGIVYEDILSAFYKFRYGMYGEIVKGREYTINTIPEKGVNTVNIRVAEETEEAKERKYAGSIGSDEDVYLVYVTVPKKMFGSKAGVVKIWFTEDFIPIEGTVKDAIGLGDVKGILIGRSVKD